MKLIVKGVVVVIQVAKDVIKTPLLNNRNLNRHFQKKRYTVMIIGKVTDII